MPDVVTYERIIEIPADLLMPQPCPAVPAEGSVQTLLDWAEHCAISARSANDQLDAIRNLQN